MADIYEKCRECEQVFVITDDEQQYFALKGWFHPIRCRPCRRLRREAAAAQEQADASTRPTSR